MFKEYVEEITHYLSNLEPHIMPYQDMAHNCLILLFVILGFLCFYQVSYPFKISRVNSDEAGNWLAKYPKIKSQLSMPLAIMGIMIVPAMYATPEEKQDIFLLVLLIAMLPLLLGGAVLGFVEFIKSYKNSITRYHEKKSSTTE
ncbi:MAG: hypothetical protein VX730_01955 [Pseudomonadota bacterium]|nr:hypothetical protein [Pseudomonadota bacterium]